MSTELLTNRVSLGIVHFSHIYSIRPAKQSAVQSLSFLTLQEDKWWNLKTQYQFDSFLTEIDRKIPISSESYKFTCVQSAFRKIPGR